LADVHAALLHHYAQSFVHSHIQPDLGVARQRASAAVGVPKTIEVTYAGSVTLLILWDVDHTLIENAGVSKLIYAAAFETLTGRPPHLAAPTEGRTDPGIMRALYQLHGLSMPPWKHVERALAQAGARHADLLKTRGSVLPGAVAVLTLLGGRSDVVQSTLTGNIRANALVKLSAFGLDALLDLDLGAYGSDGERRAELVGAARRRFANAKGREPDRTVLVGDTPRDVEAALSGGAEILAVASGIHSPAELRAAGAGTILDDLTDSARVLVALGLDG
jgi:phosphoglycolate phosphatase-like HAD superfamily hydrolase